MSRRVIPFGYSVPNAQQQLDELMQDERAMLIDIRYSVASKKKPEWSRDALLARYGKRYIWIKSLGNVNYFRHGSPIQIANIDVGIPRLLNGLEQGYTLILLCTCVKYEKCHRKVVVDELLKRMPEVEIVMPEVMYV